MLGDEARAVSEAKGGSARRCPATRVKQSTAVLAILQPPSLACRSAPPARPARPASASGWVSAAGRLCSRRWPSARPPPAPPGVPESGGSHSAWSWPPGTPAAAPWPLLSAPSLPGTRPTPAAPPRCATGYLRLVRPLRRIPGAPPRHPPPPPFRERQPWPVACSRLPHGPC